MPKRNFIRRYQSEADVVSEVVFASHQRHPRWSAQRQDVPLFKPHPILGHPIETRGRV